MLFISIYQTFCHCTDVHEILMIFFTTVIFRSTCQILWKKKCLRSQSCIVRAVEILVSGAKFGLNHRAWSITWCWPAVLGATSMPRMRLDIRYYSKWNLQEDFPFRLLAGRPCSVLYAANMLRNGPCCEWSRQKSSQRIAAVIADVYWQYQDVLH